jgi:hypothetical protein
MSFNDETVKPHIGETRHAIGFVAININIGVEFAGSQSNFPHDQRLLKRQ